MKGRLTPRYFFASALLLLILASLYVFSESRRLRQELLRQTEAKGEALAEAMETTAKHAILGNSILENLIGQRLLDNARLIDQLLLSRPLDATELSQIGASNRLQKVELLDQEGRPYEFQGPPMPRGMREMMMRRRAWESEEAWKERRAMMTYMWGRHWSLPGERERPDLQPPARLKEKKFWEGSVFGVAIGAHSFPGIIAVHANADYILNFKKEIGVQQQIEELGRQSDISYVALLDSSMKIVAHSDPGRVNEQDNDPFLLKIKGDGQAQSRIVESDGGGKHYEVVKPIRLNQSTLSYLKIGLSLAPVEKAWRQSLGSIVVLGLAILGVGILGMAVIFYNQHSHMQEVKKLESEIAQKERLSSLGNLAATVAHEIRNPLNTVSMGLQRLEGEFQPTQDEEQYSRFIGLMQGEVRRLNSIVEEFLSLARPLDLKKEAVRIDSLLQELALLAEGEARNSGVSIEVATPPDLPSVRLDLNHFKKLLLNLILNGIQAMPDGGTLTLKAETAKKDLLLTVSDTGVGIEPELRARVFEPYFTTKSNGSGLGLVIARRIAEAHGGELTVESEVGKGSRFRLSIPLEGREA